MKNVVLLGSTGSIGTSTVKVASDLPDQFRLLGLAAGYALAYLDYALPDVEWRSTHPALAKLATRLATRPAFTDNGHASSR